MTGRIKQTDTAQTNVATVNPIGSFRQARAPPAEPHEPTLTQIVSVETEKIEKPTSGVLREGCALAALAGGLITDTPTILIESVQVGSHVHANVRAGVDPDGSMSLLGMSVLRRINGGKFTIVAANNVLVRMRGSDRLPRGGTRRLTMLSATLTTKETMTKTTQTVTRPTKPRSHWLLWP